MRGEHLNEVKVVFPVAGWHLYGEGQDVGGHEGGGGEGVPVPALTFLTCYTGWGVLKLSMDRF